VVKFKGNRDPEKAFLREHKEEQHNEEKLDCNFSRARSMVLQYALCNPWQYFFTGTLSPEKWDRKSLKPFMDRLSQKIRDWRKDYGFKLDVLLVPEQHKDGSWHVHGLINNLPDYCVGRFYRLDLSSLGLGWLYPLKLVEGNFLNWYDFCLEFGYCSLAPIRDRVAAAFYITKYVSKDLSRRGGDLSEHLYFHSRPLQKAEKASDVYLYNPGLDSFCTEDYDFCKVGMVEDANWHFPYDWDGVEVPYDPLYPPVPLAPKPDFSPSIIDPDYQQLEISW
jgi:hypothetical protein